MSHPDSALIHIAEADLPPATERVAMRLLARTEWTPCGNGQFIVAWPDYVRLTECTNERAARKHLSALVRARLIHYSTHESVLYLHWIGVPSTSDRCPEDIDPMTSVHSQQPDRVSDAPKQCTQDIDSMTSVHSQQPARPPARVANAPKQCTEDIDPMSSVHRSDVLSTPSPHTRGLVGGGGKTFSHTREDPPTTTTNHQPDVRELLRELGLQPAAVPIHRELDARAVRRIIEAWREDALAKEAGIGALIYRLRRGVTPLDRAALERRGTSKYDIPEELAGILIG